MKCLEKGFGAVRIEAFVSGREKKCVCGGLKKTFSCSKMESIICLKTQFFKCGEIEKN